MLQRISAVVMQTSVSNDKQEYVVVMQKEPTIYPNAGPIYNPRLLVTLAVGLDEYHVKFQVFFKSICCKKYDTEAVDQHLQTMKPGSGYTVCPGIPNLPGEIRFKPKKYREWTLPFRRCDSIDCQLWHKPSHPKRSKDDPLYDSCASCKLL